MYVSNQWGWRVGENDSSNLLSRHFLHAAKIGMKNRT